MIAKNLIAYLEEHYPRNLAYDWDNVGLQVGSASQEVKRVLVTLDVTLEVINEAIQMEASMIIAHHPMIFRPIKDIQTDQESGKMIERLIKHDIVLYVMHTNYDIASQGMNKVLADKLELKDQEIVDFTTEEEGLGRIGTVEQTSLQSFADLVKQAFHLDHVRVIGKPHQMLSKVAIVGGSGSSVIEQAKALGADLLITGDITYHHALDMQMSGLLGIDPGHHIEVVFVQALTKEIAKQFADLLVVQSKVNTNPYQIL